MRPCDAAVAGTAGAGAYIQVASRPGDSFCAATPGDEHMIRGTRLAAAFALGAGLAAAGAALAQTGSAAPPAAAAQPAPPPAQSPLPSDQSETPATRPWDPDTGQRT